MTVTTCTPTTESFLRSVVNTGVSIGLDSMLFRKGLVSGIGGKMGSSVILCHNHTEDLDFDVLAVNRLGDLNQRLQLIPEPEGTISMTINQQKAFEDDPIQYAVLGRLEMSFKRMKISYSPAAPRAVKAPKRVGGTPFAELSFDTILAAKTLGTAKKALAVDQTTLVALSCSSGNLTVAVTDVNNDTYEDVISTGVPESFSYRYYMNYFTPLLERQDSGVPIKLSKEGIMQFTVNGFTVYHIPKV